MTGPPGPVLALDLGEARIGVAVSDPERHLALPVGTIPAGSPSGELKAVAELVRERGVTLVVIGLPLSMDGGRGPAAAKAEAFAAALRPVVQVPIELQDERLSTVEATRELHDAGVVGRQRRRLVDASAAAVVLEAWLGSHRP